MFFPAKATPVLPTLVASDADTHLREVKVSGTTLVRGHFLRAMRDEVRLPDGQLASREYVIHPGAVVIIPLIEGDDGRVRVVVERQFRYPVQQVMIEFPAGKLDPGEDRWACARRELREETGYVARQWAYAGQMHPVISYSTEFIEIWFARALTLGERQLDEGEFLDVFTATPDELMRWCRSGELTDAKTLTCMLWLNQVLSGAWALDWRDAPDLPA
jgi:ADP-ribose pyrophosphatase